VRHRRPSRNQHFSALPARGALGGAVEGADGLNADRLSRRWASFLAECTGQHRRRPSWDQQVDVVRSAIIDLVERLTRPSNNACSPIWRWPAATAAMPDLAQPGRSPALDPRLMCSPQLCGVAVSCRPRLTFSSARTQHNKSGTDSVVFLHREGDDHAQACKFRSFRQAISAESGRRFRLKPTGRFGPKRHPIPKAFGRRLQRTAAVGQMLSCTGR
jgi:hypothetical protein